MESALGEGGAAALDPEAWYRLGLLRHASGDGAAAIDAYQRALALRPGHAEAHTNLAVLLRSMGRRAEALDHLRAAVSAAPGLAPAHAALADLLRESGDVGGAEEEAAKARDLGGGVHP